MGRKLSSINKSQVILEIVYATAISKARLIILWAGKNRWPIIETMNLTGELVYDNTVNGEQVGAAGGDGGVRDSLTH
ncbi:hypothetical protein AN399_20385 [Pseudomonas aeruginosa]|nr:hypothetical protein AN399_20385 [Pseudomonas aeruginosa]